jgi:hypothetical protein
VQPWKPWDATDEEYAELQIIREDIPPTLWAPLRKWLRDVLNAAGIGYEVVNPDLVHWIETSLRVNLHMGQYPKTDDVMRAVFNEGDQFSEYQPEPPLGAIPENVQRFEERMALSGSALTIVFDSQSDGYRLRHRLPEGVEEAAQAAINDANATAGQHLAKAWREMQSLDPDTSKVLREAIQAVEAAAGEKVIPKDKKPQLSKIVAALRDQEGWGLVLAQRDDGHPDHKAVLIGMLETLAFAEQSRHSGPGYAATEALGHVQLAATLVGWFSADVVMRRQP